MQEQLEVVKSLLQDLEENLNTGDDAEARDAIETMEKKLGIIKDSLEEPAEFGDVGED